MNCGPWSLTKEFRETLYDGEDTTEHGALVIAHIEREETMKKLFPQKVMENIVD